jgi:hypothetical protein
MKKAILTIATLLLSLTMYAQNGIMTVDNHKDDVPVEQWYVISEKEYKNRAFYYGETSTVVYELEVMLAIEDQRFTDPKGMDDDHDPYWVITRESGFVTAVYFVRGKGGDEYSYIITVTE